MRRLLIALTTVAIAIALIRSNSTPALPQSPEQPDRTIDAATRSKVIETAIANMDESIFPKVAQKIKTDLRRRSQNREYDDITSATKLAQILTSQFSTARNSC